ncbi:YceI family protein [Fluviibacterium sp. S390]|uniref:YceI family protein n=1 Tax=Fluviibacterium sp. S390 TaxID=3415139 RepID=UPI003C798CDE
MKTTAFAAALGLATATLAAPVLADAEAYVLDASHSQILFSYNHLGFSTTYGLFSGFEGEIQFDAENPAASFVSVSMPVTSMFTGWEERDAHLMSGDFFGADDDDLVTFVSTGIEVTGEATALITGDLTLNGVTQAVVLDTTLNQAGAHPMAQTPWLGFDATTVLKRSDFGVDKFAPFVGDEVAVQISIEAMKAE